MTPPPSSDFSTSRRQPLGLTDEELRRFRWLGWVGLVTLLLSWAGWMSLLVIAHSADIATVTNRQQDQYQVLTDAVQEIRSDVKTLLRRDRDVTD